MSIQAVGWVLEHETTTTGAERLVLLAIANHADEDWESYPSIERIMGEANIARRQTAKDACNRLIAKGLLVRVVNGAPDGRLPLDKRPNLYRIQRPNGGTQTEPPAEAAGARETRERGLVSRSRGGTQNEPLTISEPSTEPSLLIAAASPPRQVNADAMQAQQIASAEWERRKATSAPMPLGGYPAFRARIRECLEAGYTAEHLAKALPSMSSFRQGNFEYALNGGHGKKPSPNDRIDKDRDTPSGPWLVRGEQP